MRDETDPSIYLTCGGLHELTRPEDWDTDRTVWIDTGAGLEQVIYAGHLDVDRPGAHLAEFVEIQHYVVEAGERHFVAVGDLKDRHACRVGCASVPDPWHVPFHDKAVRQGL